MRIKIVKLKNLLGKTCSERNRWFALGLAFLALNTWAILRDQQPAELLKSEAPIQVEMARKLASSAEEIEKRAELAWAFPEPMVVEKTTGIWKESGPITFSPPQSGLFCWNSSLELVFKPEKSWPVGRNIGVNSLGPIYALSGKKITFKEESFTTERLKLLAAETDSSQRHIRLRFNSEVRPEEVSNYTRVVNKDTKETVSYTALNDKSLQTIRLKLPDLSTAQLEIVIDAELRPANGENGLGKPARATVTIGKPLTIVGHRPEMYAFQDGVLYLKLSSPVPLEQIRAKLRIEPELPFQVLHSDRWWYGHCRIKAKFKSSKVYSVMLLPGVKPTKGWPNKEKLTQKIFMPRRPSDIAFLHRGSHLSPKSHLRVPVHSVNLEKMDVTICRIHPSNLVFFGMRQHDKYSGYYGNAHQGLSQPIVRKTTFPIQNIPNQPVETQLDLSRLIPEPRTGIYHVDIRGESYNQADRKVLHITDIGTTLLHSENEILVWANSISELKPLTQARVTLYSDTNQILTEGRTDANGLAQIPVPIHADAEAFMLTVEKGKDIASLYLPETKIHNTTSMDGRPYLGDAVEGHLFSDRGIYRPGEIAHFKGIVRNAKGHPPPPHPVELRIIGPDMRESHRLLSMLSKDGTTQFDLPWPRSSKLGKYTFKLAIPSGKEASAILGTCTANLEEFTAAKLEVSIKPEGDVNSLSPGDNLRFQIAAQHLIGRPGEDLQARAHFRYLPKSFKPEGWDDFRFEDREKSFPAIHSKLQAIGKIKLDARGHAKLGTSILNIQPPSSCEIQLVATVDDLAGRPVSNTLVLPINPYPLHIGIRSIQDGKKWEAVVLVPDGSLAPDGTSLQFTVNKVSRALLLRQDDNGHFRYQSERNLTEVFAQTVQTYNGRVSYQSPEPLSSGNYIIRAQHKQSGASATFELHVQEPGTKGQAWSSEEPEKVELTFDQPNYQPGETATLNIAAPFSGRALITLQKDRILEKHIIELSPTGTGQILLETLPSFAPNVWATAHVIREISPGTPDWQPHRALGRSSLRINQESRRLNLGLNLAENARPSSTFSTGIHVTDSQGLPVSSEITLWLVDEGILSLTQYQTPDPLAYFSADRKLMFQLHDPYGLLLPEQNHNPIQNRLAVGAGSRLAQPATFLNPFPARRFKNLAIWKPAIETDEDGKAHVNWELPEFSGKVRLMAVATDGSRFGSTEKQFIVKRPFSVISGLPRFLAPEDRFAMPIQLFNDDDKKLKIRWNLKLSEHLSVEDTNQQYFESATTIEPGDTFIANVHIQTGKIPGKGWIEISAQSEKDIYQERIEISIRPPIAREFKVHTGILADQESIQLIPNSSFLKETAAGKLETSPIADALLGPALESLLRYPYGCLEQTTSGSLPLLYTEDLFRRTPTETPSGDFIKQYVQSGIQRLMSMQQPNGGFGWWPGATNTYHWGTLYATQFLLEAQKAGFHVPESDLSRAIAWIKSKLGNENKEDASEIRAYSVQVLAQAGNLPTGWLKRLLETQEELSPESRIRLAMAHIYTGDRRKAGAIAKKIHAPSWNNKRIQNWNTLGSPLRTSALLLNLHVELDPRSAQTAKLAANLQNALGSANAWSTQENAMLVLAMGKYARHLGESELVTSAVFVFDGERMENKADRQRFTFLPGKLPNKLQLKNQGPGPLYYSFTFDGIPSKIPSNHAEGVRIIRTIEGSENPIIRGEVVRIDLSLDTFGNEIDHLAIQDLLPAGLEIEFSNDSEYVRHREHRDDRFLIFPEAIKGVQKFTYFAKAVTAGEYVLPAPSATCMYNSEIKSFGETGRIKIVESN